MKKEKKIPSIEYADVELVSEKTHYASHSPSVGKEQYQGPARLPSNLCSPLSNDRPSHVARA